MATLPTPRITPEEYLARERASDIRHEYYQGEIFAMAGASRQHNELTVNITTWLRTHLRGGNCRPYAGDMRLRVDATGLYTYPDVMVACDPIEVVRDDYADTLLNPRLIIEVLSDSTEAFDRGAKFQQYTTIASLVEYVMVSQTGYIIERMLRQPDDRWQWSAATGLEAVCALTSLQLTLPLSEVYADVTLAPTIRLNH